MASQPRKTKTSKRQVEKSLEVRRARLMVLAVETGRSDLQDFFEQCLRAHAIDTLKDL